ncbi:hypothetical protein RSKD131_4560 (plasmid) [Cereibacter sphaeroides KD131]|nr:hypothetical protein RSKD131_4560 [Cereibacter sphaeroides KD131]
MGRGARISWAHPPACGAMLASVISGILPSGGKESPNAARRDRAFPPKIEAGSRRTRRRSGPA